MLLGKNKSNTIKFKKNESEGPGQQEAKKYADSSLGNESLQALVTLPEGEDINEWLAANTVDFYNQINMLYGTITEFCSKTTCPVMNAGPKYEYHWADGKEIKKAIKCSAPEYVDYLMTWIQRFLDDESVFPAKLGAPFPPNFKEKYVKVIFKRLFRIYAHIYHSHFKEIVQLGEEAHLNTSFRHFILFVQEFGLVEKKELAPLQELIDALLSKETPKKD
jgi:MOB kinase activator 1